MISLLLALTLSQAPQSQFDEGVVVGRVCDDLDGDGSCAADEPGVPLARVLLETGLEAVTDADGRFHLAAVPGRVADTYAGGRLVPGRHRLKLDVASLAGDWIGADTGVTFEVPIGGAVYVAVPLRRAVPSPLTQSEEVPALRKEGQTLEYELHFAPIEGETLRLGGQEAPEGRAWLPLNEGVNELLITSSKPGAVRAWRKRVELIRRDGSTLVVPGTLQTLGSVAWPPGADAPACDATACEVTASNDGVATVLLSGAAIEIQRASDDGVTFNGLLDAQLNVDVRTGAFSFFGRGAAAARARFFGFKLGAELDLRDTDFTSAALPGNLLAARRVDVFARQLDPMQVQTAWADDSATVAANPSEGRFRVSLSREGWGSLGYGSARFFTATADVGRSHRALQGAYVDFKTPTDDSPFGVELKGIAAPEEAAGLVRREMHERFESAGGSLYFLAGAPVVQGSEVVRVEWRDAVTQLPVRDMHLKRLRDYTIDTFSGRLLLSRPLSFQVHDSLLQSDPLTLGLTPVLVVDYEYVDMGASTDGVLAGELRGRLGPVRLTASAFRQGSYGLYRGAAEATLGPVWLQGEVAYSQGAVQGLAFSRDGGLTHQRATTWESAGLGVTVRARTKGLFNKGHWDAAWRFREAGFQDIAQTGALQQISLRGEQPLGPVTVTLLGDYRDMPAPLSPFSGARITAATAGLGVGYEQRDWGVRVESRFFATGGMAIENASGAGLTVGVAGRYRVAPWLQFRAGYRQQVWGFGIDNTFVSAGFDLKPVPELELGVRGGWGPQLGPQVWGTIAYSKDNETWYGMQSIDADAPGTGERRFVTGVRQQVDANTAVFVEDISAQDVDGLRLSRAVGVTQRVDDALTISARYEHGALSVAEGALPGRARNAGGVSFGFERGIARLFASGEVRDEQGATPLRQFVASGGGELRPHRDISLTARALWTHSTRDQQLTGRSVDATAAFAWRFASGAVLARYAYRQQWTAALEEKLHVVSLLPSLRFGDRFTLGAGGHLGFTRFGPILTGSLRPAVRIWQGIEVAGEAAARTFAPDGGAWASLRGEVGYRFDHRFFVGAGFVAFGFSGTGLESGATASNDRVYLRTELAY